MILLLYAQIARLYSIVSDTKVVTRCDQSIKSILHTAEHPLSDTAGKRGCLQGERAGEFETRDCITMYQN